MNSYITLDYELGMGSNTGTPEKCLIEPMNYLCQVVDKYGVKMNIFVDAAYLLRLKELKGEFPQMQKDYDTVTSHIKKLDAEGHAIQLHLHPQWCYSDYDGEHWQLDYDHYKLSDMPIVEQKQLIVDGTTLLNSFINRKVTSFRAGGYSIENFNELYETFLSVGIVSDTSVLRGAYAKGKYQTYNYRRIPKKTSYRIMDNIKSEDNEGLMKEYPIATMFSPYIVHFIKKYLSRGANSNNTLSKKKWGDGVGIGIAGGRLRILSKRLIRFFTLIPMRACIDECYSFENVYNYSIKEYNGDEFVIMGHPKLISPCSIAILEQFIKCHPEVEFKLFPSK